MSTAAVGVFATSLPLAVSEQPVQVATAALLAQPAAAVAGRWIARRFGDRHGTARVLTPAVVLTAAGVATTAATGSPGRSDRRTLVFGTWFGLLRTRP